MSITNDEIGFAFRQGAIACRETYEDDTVLCPHPCSGDESNLNQLRESWMSGFHSERINSRFGPLFRIHGAE